MNKRLKSPINVQIEVTSMCTSECMHCYNFWRKDACSLTRGNFDALSKEDAKTIMQKLGEAEVFQVTVTGGEPLMSYPTTLSCIELARSMNMGVGLNSNMVLLTKKRAVELKRAGLNHILTSILGPSAEIHDVITQRPRSFERLIAAVKVAHDAGLRVSANMVVSQLNHNQVRATAEVVAKLGIKSFMATKAGCPGNCSDFSQIAPSHGQLVAFLNDLCWAHEELGLEVDTLEPVPLCALCEVSKPDLFTSRKCTAGITTATISYDGSVRPCSHLDLQHGNLLREKLDDIWVRMDPWSQLFQLPSECSNCELKNTCGSGCRMEAKTRTGKIDGLDPYSQVENSEKIAIILRGTRKQMVQKPSGIFKTSKFRIRSEKFGGLLVTPNSFTFLDHRGYAVASKLRPETTYDIRVVAIDWAGLDPEKFLAGLSRRRAISFV